MWISVKLLIFSILNKHDHPTPIFHFFYEIKVVWGSSLAHGFSMSNGVWQGDVPSPYLFSVNLDGPLNFLVVFFFVFTGVLPLLVGWHRVMICCCYCEKHW